LCVAKTRKPLERYQRLPFSKQVGFRRQEVEGFVQPLPAFRIPSSADQGYCSYLGRNQKLCSANSIHCLRFDTSGGYAISYCFPDYVRHVVSGLRDQIRHDVTLAKGASTGC